MNLVGHMIISCKVIKIDHVPTKFIPMKFSTLLFSSYTYVLENQIIKKLQTLQ